MTESRKKILIKGLKWLLVAALCIASAYVSEKYILNRNTARGLNREFELSEVEQTGFVYKKGKLITEEAYAKLVLPAGGYINKMRIEYATKNMAEATWSTEAPVDCVTGELKNVWQFDYRTNTAIKNIRQEGENLYITFLNPPSPITIKSISMESEYLFHWQRFLLIAATFLSMVIILGNGKSIVKHPERVVAAVCLLMGVAMLGTIPYEKNSWDDETHFANAYRMSYAMLGQDTQWVEATDEFINLGIPFTGSYEDRLAQKEHMDMAGNVETEIEENLGIGYYLNKIDALPTAIGILIGRLSGADFSDWFVAARLVNLLLYTVIMYFAVKLVPIGKSLMAFLALIPTPLFLTVSYSTDYFMNSLMMLGTAVFLKEYLTPEEKLTRKSIIIFVAAMFFACMRKAIYIPIILIGLLLPESKFESKKARNIYRGIIVGCCVLVMLAVVFSASGMTDVRGGDTSVSGQIAYILKNPISFAFMFVKEIARSSINYIFNGEAKVNFNISGMRRGTVELITVISLIGAIVCARGADEKKKIGLKTSIIGLGLIGLVICFIWGSMYLSYTPVGAGSIQGVQARHYVPFLFLLFILLPLDKIKCYISEKIIMQGTLIMVVLINVASIYGILLKA